MKESRFTEEQIAFALKQAETGTPVAEVLRGTGISEQAFFRWKKPCGGLGTGELRRLRQLEEENRKLQQFVADDEGQRVEGKAGGAAERAHDGALLIAGAPRELVRA